MKRRAYLRFAGVAGVAGIAGCSSGSGNPEVRGTPSPTEITSTPTPTPTPTESPTPTATDTPTPEPAAFELVSVDSPDTVEIGAETSYAFTVKNTGEQIGKFETKVYSAKMGEEYGEGATWSDTIEGGDTLELQSQRFNSEYMTEYKILIGSFDHEFTIKFVSAKRQLGGSYPNPNDVSIRVNGVSFANSYTWTSSGYEYTERPKDGHKWAFVNVTCKNRSGSPEYLPSRFDFVALAGNRQYDSHLYYDESNRYEGGEVQAGVVREGNILFEVPESTTKSDLTVVWSQTYFSGDVAVYWSGG